MGKDWTGNSKAAIAGIAPSNRSVRERAGEDYYATDPKAVEMLCDLEDFSPTVLEPACGEGHIAKVLQARGYKVIACDLVDRGFGEGGIDFLKVRKTGVDADIVTNPPYKLAQEFVEKAMEVVSSGHKVAMFLKLTFLETARRRELFKKYPRRRSTSRRSASRVGRTVSRRRRAWFATRGSFGRRAFPEIPS